MRKRSWGTHQIASGGFRFVNFNFSRPLRSIAFSVAIALSLAALGGCEGSDQTVPAAGSPDGANPAKPTGQAPAKLELLVVGDAAMAKEIVRLRGEWLAQSGSPLSVSQMSSADLEHAHSLSADAVIYPASELGTLAERRLIRPLQPAWLERPIYDKADLFELPGLRETAWGEQTYAVPLGSPVLVCFYRADLFQELGREPPRNWAEYQRLIEFFAERVNSKPRSNSGVVDTLLQAGTLEPLAAGWAGSVLLARAAAYSKHRDYYSTLFDSDSLEPRIAGEPFVRALTELVASAKLGPKSQLNFSPADVRREFFAGHAAMALSWPSPTGRIIRPTAAAASAAPISIGFVQLPGSSDVFNPRDRQWQTRKPDDEPRVPLLGIAGRMGSVVRGSSSADAAFSLLAWLSSDEWSARICTASPATTLFRRSQMAQVRQWVDPDMAPAAAKQYAGVAAEAFSASNWLFVPRLPGHEEYMAALDDAVRQAVEGKATPAAALADAAEQWQKITDRLGRTDQKHAYARSHGLEP